jgi:hypothetical protein
MAVVSPTAKAQFIDAAGIPLAGGFLYTYEAGTTTPQATYTDSTAATANSNPIVLDSRGEANIWLSSANYKFKLTNSEGTEIWTVDNIAAPSTALSPVFSSNVTISANTSGPALLVTQTGAGAAIRVQDSADPDSSPFVVDTTGQVGIGTATPANAIDVAGGAIQISTSGGVSRTVMSADSTDSIFDVSDDRNFTVKTNAGTRLTINSSGSTFTGSVTATSFTGAWANIPSGTAMLFAQTTAPTGWTKSTTHDNKALRVVSGAASSGGSVAFTTAFASQAVTGTVASYTLTTADIPSHNHSASTSVSDSGHTHTFGGVIVAGGSGGLAVGASYTGNQTGTTGTGYASLSASTSISNTGGGGGHAHGFSAPSINLAVQYVDVIIATKN